VREADRENLVRARPASVGAHTGEEGEHGEVVSTVGNGASGAGRETSRREGTDRGSSISWRALSLQVFIKPSNFNEFACIFLFNPFSLS
jgi:hypothetical protein